jgi:HEAT repeat protein
VPDARAKDALVRALKSSSIDVRTEAAKVLSGRKDCCPVDPLLAAFEDRRGRAQYESDAFRSMVALALGATKNPLALRRLIAGVRNKIERPAVRSSIAEALGQFEDATAADALIAIVENTREDESVRSSAARSVGQTRDPRAVPLLIQTLMDPQRDVRGGAASSLRFFREARVVEALIRAIAMKNVYDPPNALETLKDLTGQKLDSTVAWQKWWQDNKNTLDQQKQ